MVKEKLSVSMCVYRKDNPEWFQMAVNSIVNQTIKPDEIVLVVDGPISEELDFIIREYEKNDLFNIIRLPRNVGHGNARRIGLHNCRNKLVALMDADDISVNNRFEKQLEVFRSYPNVSIVGGHIEEFSENVDTVIGRRCVPTKDNEIKEYLKRRCPFNQMTVMFKKDDVNSVGGYQDWYCNEDYFLWIRMYLAEHVFMNIDEVLVKVRVGEELYKRRGGRKYFESEYRLQKYMLSQNIIGKYVFCMNVLKRFIVQMILPNSWRFIIYKLFART